MSDTTLEDIKAFAVGQLWPLRNVSGQTALAHDFAIAGLDGKEFMEAYASRFNVDLADFDWIEFFGAEVGANPLGVFAHLYDSFARGIPARRRVGLPEITLDHLVHCANAGRWHPP